MSSDCAPAERQVRDFAKSDNRCMAGIYLPRAGQLSEYQQLPNAGDTALEAAEGAFGGLDRLERDVDSYLERHRLSYLTIERSALPIGPIRLRALTPGEAAIMPTLIRSAVGVTRNEALANKVQSGAATEGWRC